VKAIFKLSSPIASSARVLQCSGMFDLPAAERSEIDVDADLPIEEKPWNVGLIVGPSGCGKSSIARHLWPTEFAHQLHWPKGKSVLDAFPGKMGIKDIVGLMSSVGFSSPPAWMRPFHVLSNGERFRVEMARLLAELPALAVIDEFTSVVDRTVAQIGSCALAKTVRRRKQKLVAVTCHDDVERWLQPDWVYRPAERRFAWRSVQRRPAIDLTINRVHHSAWELFKPHHYLTAAHSASAVSFVAFWRDQPVAFESWLPFVGRTRDSRTIRRGHRLVCLPDFQGVGIGAALREFLSSMWLGMGCRAVCNTAHPAEIASVLRSKNYTLLRAPSLNNSGGSDVALTKRFNRTRAAMRLTASFEFVGKAMPRKKAEAVLNTWAEIAA
jgi:GNAT superfamily N-acetyltransferase